MKPINPYPFLIFLAALLLLCFSASCGDDEITVRFNITVVDGNTGDIIPDGEVDIRGYMPAGIGNSGRLYNNRRPLVEGHIQFVDQMDDRVEEFIFLFYRTSMSSNSINVRVLNCPDGTIDLNPGCQVNDAREFTVTILVF